MKIPYQVQTVLAKLRDAGFEVYPVGGCVRDTLLGRSVNDWDAATNATVEEMQRVFSDFKLIGTGLRHGTVTVLFRGVTTELTVYRGGNTLRDDLLHRDLTINAMAFAPDGGIIDPCGGKEDLKRGLLRCPGDPVRRLREDPLRILRVMRFASVLDMQVEESTAAAMHALRETMTAPAVERVKIELDKLLCGPGAGRVLDRFRDIAAVILPELAPCFDFEQHNPHHDSDVWHHTLRSVDAAPAQLITRWCMLLHDIGKPETFTIGENGIGHFYDHQKHSELLADGIMKRLRFDNRSREEILFLIHYHMLMIPLTETSVKRALRKYGLPRLKELLPVFTADRLALAPDCRDTASIETLRAMIDAAASECFEVKSLMLNGYDIMALGYRREAVGQVLDALVDAVLTGECGNTQDELEDYILRRRELGALPYALP